MNCFAEAARGGRALLLTERVPLETIWVLRSYHRRDMEAIASSLKRLVGRSGVVSDAPGLFEDALDRVLATGQAPWTACSRPVPPPRA